MPLKKDHSAKSSSAEQILDPVLPDQGGRMTAADPTVEYSYESIEESVRRKAYELYERKGRRDGQALNDWIEAEAQFR